MDRAEAVTARGRGKGKERAMDLEDVDEEEEREERDEGEEGRDSRESGRHRKEDSDVGRYKMNGRIGREER